MEQITLGQIGLAITFIVSITTGIGYITKQLKKWIKASLNDQLHSINKRMDELYERVEDVDIETTKNYLVTFLSHVTNGDKVEEIEKERFWEQYEHYIRIGGNSYIKRKVEQLEEDGII